MSEAFIQRPLLLPTLIQVCSNAQQRVAVDAESTQPQIMSFQLDWHGIE
jgi:hypothetical protein